MAYENDMHHWTKQARQCYELDSVCSLCPIHTVYGLHKDAQDIKKGTHVEPKQCHMPEMVKIILAKHGPPEPKPEPKEPVYKPSKINSHKLHFPKSTNKSNSWGSVEGLM